MWHGPLVPAASWGGLTSAVSFVTLPCGGQSLAFFVEAYRPKHPKAARCLCAEATVSIALLRSVYRDPRRKRAA